MKGKFNLKTIFVAIAIIYVSTIFIGHRISAYNIKKEITVRQEELNKLKEQNQRLQDEVNDSKTNDYKEKIARERLGLIKENEIPVIHSSNKSD